MMDCERTTAGCAGEEEKDGAARGAKDMVKAAAWGLTALVMTALLAGWAGCGEEKVVQQKLLAEEKTIAVGTFVGLEGHDAEGTVRLVKLDKYYYLKFGDDFEVTEGPELFVYLGRDGEYLGNTLIGPLRGNSGPRTYHVPTSISADEFNEVWVWCRKLSAPWARAVLE